VKLRSKEIFDSQGWLNISSDGILEFLDMDSCCVKEVSLVWGLITWGKYQLQKQDQNANLRSQILPGLRKIRFDTMNPREIAELFEKELGQVLTAHEKCSIFMANIKGDWTLMPTDVVSPTKPSPRNYKNAFVNSTSIIPMYIERRRSQF
jgi:hypothetical protein